MVICSGKRIQNDKDSREKISHRDRDNRLPPCQAHSDQRASGHVGGDVTIDEDPY